MIHAPYDIICATENCQNENSYQTFPYCSDCLSNIHGLRVGPSAIHGLGLFTTKTFRAQHIFKIQYGGFLFDSHVYDCIYSSQQLEDFRRQAYVLEVAEKPHQLFLDGTHYTGGPLRYINEPPKGITSNVKWFHQVQEFISSKNPEWTTSIKTTKPVNINDELMVIYDKNMGIRKY